MASCHLPSYVPKMESLNAADLRFSQNSINNRFSAALGNEYIGEVVDKICDGDTNLLDRILDNMAIARAVQSGMKQVSLEGSKSQSSTDLWYTVNNRSLWVLKQLQSLGKLNQVINLKVDPRGIDHKRFTTRNSGSCVEVRTRPVGGVKSVQASFWRYKLTLVYGGYATFQSGGERDDYVSVEWQSGETADTMTDKNWLDALKSVKLVNARPCMSFEAGIRSQSHDSDRRTSKDGMSEKTPSRLFGPNEPIKKPEDDDYGNADDYESVEDEAVEDDGYDSDEYYS